MKNIFYKPLFWILTTLVSLIVLIISIHYFPHAFPVVNVDITMNRAQALDQARLLATTLSLEPHDCMQAASFETDALVQTFVELEAGGKKAFIDMIENHLYEPYIWKVRHFKEYTIEEATLFFTPDGKKYGFSQKLPLDKNLPSLDLQAAQKRAQKIAIDWDIDLNVYTLIETSQETTPSGRTDHTFVYQRNDTTIGQGFYRLKIIIRGNQVSELTHFIKVPEDFIRRYAHMRSYNNTLAMVANLIMMVVYFFGCCIIGLFLLFRAHKVIYQPAYKWGIFIAFLGLLVQINQLPLTWMQYNNAHSMYGFLLNLSIQMLISFLYHSFFFSFIFMGAESLTRAAFGNHIQFWQLYTPCVASSYAVLGRTIAGYLLVSIVMGLVVSFYAITTQYCGWWLPSSVLFDPNVLATYAPWLASIAISLRAGFFEECLFRAIPLATAALIGKRYGKKNWWIAAAFIIQAIIFGAAHANYPAQPFYARLIELIIPSFTFGGIYLAFGLLPSIIAHFIYDVGWFALPIFISTAPGALAHKIIIIFLALIPVWIVFYYRFKKGAWTMLDDGFLNRSWHVAPQAHKEYKPLPPAITTTLSRKMTLLLYALSSIALVTWVIITPFKHYAHPIAINRKQAFNAAAAYLTEHSSIFKKSWTPMAKSFNNYQDNEYELDAQTFAWQHDTSSDKHIYTHLLNNYYLHNPHWIIRWAQFEGDIIERAEEYQFHIDTNGAVYWMNHIVPESQKNDQLSVDAARTIALNWITTHYTINANTLTEISATATQHPARKDWTFIFSASPKYDLQGGQARITTTVAGKEVINSFRWFFVPEEWKRNEQNRRQLAKSIQMICFLIFFIIFSVGTSIAVAQNNVSTFSKKLFFTLFTFFGIIFVSNTLNTLPIFIAEFNTIEPFWNQFFMIMGLLGINQLLQVTALALIAMYILHYRTKYRLKHHYRWVVLAIGTGIILATIKAIMSRLNTNLHPLWASYDYFSHLLPAYSIISHTLKNYCIITLALLSFITIIDYVTECWTQRKRAALLLFLLFSASLQGIGGIAYLHEWLMQSAIMGVTSYLLYALFLRWHHALIPIIMGSFFIGACIQQFLFNAFSQALIGYGITILFLIGISYRWFRRMDAID